MKIKCEKCGHEFWVDSKRKPGHANVFHAIAGEWAKDMGQAVESIKVRWKHDFGVWRNYPCRPPWPGQFYEIDGEIIFMKSTTAYTRDEMRELVRGAKAECFDADVDLSILDVYDRRKKEAKRHGNKRDNG